MAMKQGGARKNMAQVAKELEDKLLRNHNVCLVFGMAGIGLMVAENYILWSHGGEPDGTCEVLKLATSFTTAFLVLFLYVYHRRKFEHMRITNALLQRDTFVSSGILMAFALEALYYLVHAPPFVNVEFDVHFFDLQQSRWLPSVLSTDELFTLLMMFARFSLVVRTLRYASGVESAQTRGYSNMNNLNVTTAMALRMLYERFPFGLLTSLSAVLLPMFAFGMQMAERRANHNLDHYPNALWLIFVSATSVGFGDFVPLSSLGRAMDALAILWGFLMYAAAVELLLRLTKLSKGEARVSKIVSNQIANTKLRQYAAFYVQAAWASYLERLQREQSASSGSSLMGSEPLQSDAKFCNKMRSFRELRKSMQQTDDDVILIFKEVLDSRSRLEGRLRDLEEKLEEMDAKFEHNIAAMNELLQKNLKYLKHVAS